MAEADVTPARLRELFSYCPETGALTWAIKRGRANPGDPAGIVSNRGHIKVKVHGHCFQGHRIIWAIVTGAWPAEQIDHRDGNKTNNRWANLREATPAMNAQNLRVAKRKNKTGFLGVHVSKHDPGCFVAQIKLSGKRYNLGTFKSAEAAHAAYVAAKRVMHIGCTI